MASIKKHAEVVSVLKMRLSILQYFIFLFLVLFHIHVAFKITPHKNLCDTEKWIRIGKVCGTRYIVLAEKVEEGLVGGETCKR